MIALNVNRVITRREMTVSIRDRFEKRCVFYIGSLAAEPHSRKIFPKESVVHIVHGLFIVISQNISGPLLYRFQYDKLF